MRVSAILEKKARGRRRLKDMSIDNYWQTVEKKSRGSRLPMDGSVCWLLLATFGKKLRGRREEVADVSNFWKKNREGGGRRLPMSVSFGKKKRGRRLPMDASVGNYWQTFEKNVSVCRQLSENKPSGMRKETTNGNGNVRRQLSVTFGK